MTNKIGSGGIDNRPVQVGSGRVKTSKDSTEAAAAGSAKPVAATGGEGVRITDSARQLAALELAIRELPDVDDAKVAQVRTAIANGTYKVSPDRIAEKLMRLENDLR